MIYYLDVLQCQETVFPDINYYNRFWLKWEGGGYLSPRIGPLHQTSRQIARDRGQLEEIRVKKF